VLHRELPAAGSEKFLFVVNLIQKKLSHDKKIPTYVPDFSLAFEHICIHSGA
jgi:3-ketoacyl-CoA synthase